MSPQPIQNTDSNPFPIDESDLESHSFASSSFVIIDADIQDQMPKPPPLEFDSNDKLLPTQTISGTEDVSTMTPLPIPDGHKRQLLKRQSIVTQTIITSSATPTQTSTSSQSFPVAVAVPALIGGMAIALLGAGLWWWISKRNRRKKRERWEAHQRRKQRKQRGRANSVSSRPTMYTSKTGATGMTGGSAGRYGSPAVGGGAAPGTIEKEKEMMSAGVPAPPVPALPKEQNPYNAYNDTNYGYGQPQGFDYNNGAQPQQDDNGGYDYNGNPIQPNIDEYNTQAAYADAYDQDQTYDNNGSYGGITEPEPQQPGTKESSKKSKKGAKRVEAAENAAAREAADPMARYKPNKPSPLALAAAEQKRLASAGAGSNGSGLPMLSPSRNSEQFEYQETLNTPNHYDSNYSQYPNQQTEYLSDEGHNNNNTSSRNGKKIISGEWGVGGGSVQSGYRKSQDQSNTFNDPYLSVNGQKRQSDGMGSNDSHGMRAPSGQYTTDPYDNYHRQSQGQGQQALNVEVKVEKAEKKGMFGRWI